MQIVSVEQSLRNIIYISWTERLLRPEPKEAGCYDEYEEFYSERPVNSLLYSIVMETEEDNVLHDTRRGLLHL